MHHTHFFKALGRLRKTVGRDREFVELRKFVAELVYLVPVGEKIVFK